MKISDLPIHEQISYQVFVLQEVMKGLLRQLKTPILNRLGDMEVERDRDITEIALPTTQAGKHLVPSPKQIRDMISSQGVWFLEGPPSVNDFAADRLAREMVKAFLGVSDKIT